MIVGAYYALVVGAAHRTIFEELRLQRRMDPLPEVGQSGLDHIARVNLGARGEAVISSHQLCRHVRIGTVGSRIVPFKTHKQNIEIYILRKLLNLKFETNIQNI